VQHPGILRALEYKDHERGAALIFDHDPEALRLGSDWIWMASRFQRSPAWARSRHPNFASPVSLR
jgi:hypothetical protein